MDNSTICAGLKHLNDGKKIAIFYANGTVVVPCAGDHGIASAVDLLFGDDSDLIRKVEIMDEPAPCTTMDEYIVAHSPATIGEKFYHEIKALTLEDADAMANSIVEEGHAGGVYDLYMRVL